MSETIGRRVPGTVRCSVAGLCLETVLFVFTVVEMFLSAHDKTSHGQSGAGQFVLAGLFLVPVAALWGGCAVIVARGVPWARLLAVILQAFFVFAGLITLVVALAQQDVIGLVVAVCFIAVAAAIAGPLLAPGAREWFGVRLSSRGR